MRNTFYTWHQQNRGHAADTTVFEEDMHSLEVNLAERDASPEAMLIRSQSQKRVHQALRRLRLEYREVVVLRELEELQRLHRLSFANREAVSKSDVCGCFFCLKTFSGSAISQWVDESRDTQTAMCPHCGIDSVLASGSGIEITPEVLAGMNQHYFSSNDM